MSRPQERSTAGPVSYTWVARSRLESTSQFTVIALNKPSSSSSSSSYGARCLCWARAPSGSATCERVVPTDRHAFVETFERGHGGPGSVASDGSKLEGGNSLDAVTPGLTLGTLYSSGVGINKTKQHTSKSRNPPVGGRLRHWTRPQLPLRCHAVVLNPDNARYH